MRRAARSASPPLSPPAAAQPAGAPPTETELLERKSLSELDAEHSLGNAFFDHGQHTLREDATRRNRMCGELNTFRLWYGLATMGR